MSTLEERNRLIRECWVDVRLRLPEPDPRGPHFAVEVLGVIRDPLFVANGDKEFVDIVAWWPAARKWTVTYQSAASTEAQDFECQVAYWQPPLPLPWG